MSAAPETLAASTSAATATATTSPPAKRVKTDLSAMDRPPPLQVKKLSDKARLPTRGSAFAAGYDIYAAKDTVVPARGKVLVDTDISIAVPAGTCEPVPSSLPPSLPLLHAPFHTGGTNHCRGSSKDGRIAPRSGLAAKHFIDTGAGVIDADYRGQVKVLLFNHSDAEFAVQEGDRVAQLVIERICTPEVVEVEELEESLRGAGGFGSTGGFANGAAA
ncbi:dUTP pyrophosphatase [Metarhizium album ARSEF 1941]|uniref:Deoxyuridine 5'-triphosphate nucleotidohydrolase n=1 Tax=Metarhizium album (strain ARSEF 1941) TaxID=1081103 RepID=A0A0B2WQV9_METAS|nr:dUTP pyrophosphatase [Metarhizium album ARSEF 1941]KHN95355.1 dUTP pyrophosphatase [Metarhizium album ARSEF 1941]